MHTIAAPVLFAFLALFFQALATQPAQPTPEHRSSAPSTEAPPLPTPTDLILERTTLPAEPGSKATVERIVYRSDGLRIVGYIAYPADALGNKSKLPCLVFNRGGNRSFGETDDRWAQMLGGKAAEWGYVFFTSNLRGSTGSEGQDEFGGADVNDIINGLGVLDALPFADTSRIGMWGHSRGGMMTYLALTRTKRVRAAIVGAGLSDMARCAKLRPEMEENVFNECIPNWKTQRDDAIHARSAVLWADKLPTDVPVLIVHGTSDWRVDPRDALDIAVKLQEAKRPYRLLMLEGGDHGLFGDHKETYDNAIRDWLDRYVKPEKPKLPNLEPHGA
ncbi:MAG TPA: prolyl oligopeptidase family serine peptidase [Phycisphaerales bacterium]|nr:prolyl oligopeptidase family serine peptidase [Phycisphaerales bacterium]